MAATEPPSDEIVLYGAEWCPDCRRSKTFLNDQQIGMADMSAKFAAVGGELYVSETGEKRDPID